MMGYTTLDEDDIYLIKGVGSLTKLFSQIDKDIAPKAILASSQTIRRYCEYGEGYRHLPHPSRICELLDVGIMAVDEAHEHFFTNYLVNILSNPQILIPITATFIANDPFVKHIFDKMVPPEVQFVGGEYDKYVNVTAYMYNCRQFFIKPFHYSSPQGYSQTKFEKYLLSRKGAQTLDTIIHTAILPVIKNHYDNIAEHKEKLLFLCDTTDMCDHMSKVFAKAFPNRTSSVFYTKMPATVLEKYDIICSTPGSAGTGRDVKNLRTCFVFTNTASEIRNRQFLGRLRKFPAVKNTPEFVYLSLSCIPKHISYHGIRSSLYGPLSLTFKHRSIG
jgi:superfamily II DNA or RNA helicase